MGAAIKCYRNKCIPGGRCLVSCFGCQRLCFRPSDEDLIQEFCERAKINDYYGLNQLAGRVRVLKGEDFQIGTLCGMVPESDIVKRKISALHFAAMGDHLETLLVILKLPGCDPNTKESACHYTALHFACKEGHVAMTNILIKYKSDINARDWKKNTALILAAANGHQRCIKALVDNGANLNVRNNNGFTGLIAAIINARRESSLMLIKLGASLEISDSAGNTPLHLAILRGDRHVVKFLLQCGAKVATFNHWQASTLDEARRSKSLQILALIEDAWSKHRESLGLSPGLGKDKKSVTSHIEDEDNVVVIDIVNEKKPQLPLTVGGGGDNTRRTTDRKLDFRKH